MHLIVVFIRSVLVSFCPKVQMAEIESTKYLEYVPNLAATFSNLNHLIWSLASAASGVDEGCNIVVRGERQLPNKEIS